MKKRTISLLLAALMLLTMFSACSGNSSAATTAAPAETTAAPAETAAETEAAAEMSYDELVELAKQDGKLVFYGANSYLQDAANNFAEEFGIEVEFTQLGETEMIEKIAAECKTGAPTADLVCAQDTYRVNTDLIGTGYAMNWTNSRITDITGETDCTAVIWQYDTKMFMYNPTLVGEDWAYNLWRITDPEYYGLFTFKTPTSEGVNLDMLTMLTSDTYAEKLAEAYKEYYGKDITLTTDNAGWEFVKMMYENGVLLTSSDSTCATTIGDVNLDKTWMGYFSTQRYSTQEAKGIKLAYDYNKATPFAGYTYPVYAVVLNGCQHENAAKLFAEWLLSENGYKAFETYFGGFSANPANAYATSYSFDDVKPYLVQDDADYLMDARVEMEDFLDSIQ